MSVQRFTKERPCPICRGWDRMERGEGKRCHGYISSDRTYAHCAREDRAGNIEPRDTNLYAHKLAGKCKCGETHGDARNDNAVKTYHEYRDESGTPLFRVVREGSGPSKRIYQERAEGSRWIGGQGALKSVRLVLYRLPELLAADPETTVYVVEGEKCVDALAARGLVATCNPMGASNWKATEDLASKVLRGRHIVVLPDADDEGEKWCRRVVASLAARTAASLEVVRLYRDDSKRDVFDWFAEGHTAAELVEMVQAGDGQLDNDRVDPPQSDPWKTAIATALTDVRAKLTATTDGTCEPLFDLDAVDVLAKKFDGARWLVTGLITRGGITTIGGLPKAAKKTWLGTEIAIAIATGTPVCGEFYAEHGVVAYFYAEDMEDQIQNRIRSLLAGAGRRLERGRLRPCPRGKFLDITRDDDLAWIVASCRRLGKLDALVLDPLRDIHSAAEDKSDEMSPVMKRLRLLAEILDCTVVIVHHSGKPTQDNAKRGGGQRLRGSGAVHGSTDSGIYILSCDGDGRNKFHNTIESEIKGARSAGTFRLDLEIEDDEQGAAVATWTFSRPDDVVASNDARVDRELDEDEAVIEYIRRLARQGIRLSKTALRARPDRPRKENGDLFGERMMTKIIDRLLSSRRVLLHDGVVVISASECSPNA